MTLKVPSINLCYILMLLTISLAQQSYGQDLSSTKTVLQAYTTEDIHLAFEDSENSYYAIAGKDSSKLLLFKKLPKKWSVNELNIDKKSPKSIKFNTIYKIDSKKLLVGTASSFIFYIKDRRVVHLNQTFGISDSTTLSIQKKGSETIVCTPSGDFLYTGYKNKKTPCFHKIFLENTNDFDVSNLLKTKVRLPLQRAICNMASPVDLSFRKHKYIKHKELKSIKEELKPGDILIRRNDDQLSNVGIPGFWKHAAIYVGGPNDINAYFDSISLPNNLKPAEYLKQKNPKVYKKLMLKHGQIIEVVGKGVIFNPVEHMAKSDYLAALRPNLTKEQIFQALVKAFDNYGLPYDFLFEFKSNNALVCSELVYQAYQSTPDYKGISFQMGIYADQPFLSPNDIAVQYANEYKTSHNQLKLIFFYDADTQGKVTRKAEEEFAKSIGR